MGPECPINKISAKLNKFEIKSECHTRPNLRTQRAQFEEANLSCSPISSSVIKYVITKYTGIN